jgi:hypothetical protein
MRTFKDNAGRSWTVTVNVDCIKRVRSLLDVDLLEAAEGKLLERLTSDPVLLCDVLYCACKPQADAERVSDEEFGRSMAGDAIDHATTALLEELVDFFPGPKRLVLRKALEKLKQLETRAYSLVNARLDSPELEKKLEAALSELGNSSGSWPGSSASTPAG